MSEPHFSHIHCSSRYDRPAADLEKDVDDWRAKASLITLTEVGNDNHARTLAEKGWGYYNAKKNGGADEAAICWDKDVWKQTDHLVRKLNTTRLAGARAWVWSCTCLLKHANSGHRLLVCVAHAPAHVDIFSHAPAQYANNETAMWAARKRVYMQAMTAWSGQVKDLVNKKNPDAALVVGDFNINLKEDWARHYLKQRFDHFRLAWVRFPTEGGSLTGGPVAPLGAPGKATGDRIIDGSLYRGLEVTDPPNLMRQVRSSDHRPYQEGYVFNNAAGKGFADGKDKPAHGDTKHGDEWWGFGDYLDDEIYALVRVTEDA